MTGIIKKAQNIAATAFIAVKTKADEIKDKVKSLAENREGQGTLDVAITVLISVVLGALILGGVYLIVNNTVLPAITTKIEGIFNYKGK